MRRLLLLPCLLATLASAQNKPATKKSPPKPPAATAKPATPPHKSALDKATLEAYLRYQFQLPANLKVIIEDPKPSDMPSMWNVAVTVTDGGPTKQNVEFFVSQDGSKILQGKVFNIAESPFSSELKLLKTAGAPAAGPAAAPVTLAVFSDFQCQYCKEAAKTLRTHLEKEFPTQVRLVFKDFPLEQIHPWAKQAAVIGRCFNKLNPTAFWQYHDWIFEQQANITPETVTNKSLEFAMNRVDSIQLNQCLAGKLTEKDVEASTAEARALQVASTPTMFVNGRRLVGNVPWEQLKAVIDYELDHVKNNPPVASGKDEACCEVKLAIPGVK